MKGLPDARIFKTLSFSFADPNLPFLQALTGITMDSSETSVCSTWMRQIGYQSLMTKVIISVILSC